MPEPAASPILRALHRRSEEGVGGSVEAPVLLLVGYTGLPRINDSGGQGRGDRVLGLLGARLSAVARARWGAGALVERLRGPRHALLTPPGATLAEAVAEIRRLHDRLGEPIAEDPGGRIVARALAVALDPAMAPEAALRAALPLLARAGATREAADVRGALDDDEIDVLFQPQFDGAGRLRGLEALARWRHPTRGALGADALLRAAGVAGLVPEVGAAIHARALRALADAPAGLATLTLALNVTAEDLVDPLGAERFLGRLADAGIAPTRVVAEVTEAAMLPAGPEGRATMIALRAAGVRCAADDFGTGFSALAWLKDLPLDILKLDRALIADIAHDPRARSVVVAVTGLARELGLEVVAEGVETEAQRDAAMTAGCARWQGYLGAEPMTMAHIVSRWRAGDWRI